MAIDFYGWSENEDRDWGYVSYVFDVWEYRQNLLALSRDMVPDDSEKPLLEILKAGSGDSVSLSLKNDSRR